MKKRRVVVTGMGVVSPFGAGVEKFWNGLLEGRSAVRPIESFNASVFRSELGAQVPREVYDDLELRNRCGAPEEDAAYFAVIAAEEALKDAGIGPVFKDEDRVGCILGTLCAGARNLDSLGGSLAANGKVIFGDISAESVLVSYQLDFVARKFNLTGPSSLVSTACASTTDAIGYATDCIRYGECDIALAGGGDVLGEVIHGGFNSLFSITQSKPKPFDKARDGFVIGEGAGMLVLEEMESARLRGAYIYAEVAGYGLSNTAFHLTATSDDGAGEALAIERALADSGITAGEVKYINTHGTATLHNDVSEVKAVRLIFGDGRNIIANSIKPAIGHCMGAAGIMEAISTILSVSTGWAPPTINTSADEDTPSFRLITGKAEQASIDYAISESFGFGGACSCVVFKACNGSIGS